MGAPAQTAAAVGQRSLSAEAAAAPMWRACCQWNCSPSLGPVKAERALFEVHPHAMVAVTTAAVVLIMIAVDVT